MANLPFASNNTCDIYRHANAPPANPDVAGVRIYFKEDYTKGSEANEGAASGGGTALQSQWKWTHIAFMPQGPDVRDGYTGGNISQANADFIWVPNKNQSKYLVIFVERVNRGQATDYLRVYLQRVIVPWPSNEV